jgi:hypothetical protein
LGDWRPASEEKLDFLPLRRDLKKDMVVGASDEEGGRLVD